MAPNKSCRGVPSQSVPKATSCKKTPQRKISAKPSKAEGRQFEESSKVPSRFWASFEWFWCLLTSLFSRPKPSSAKLAAKSANTSKVPPEPSLPEEDKAEEEDSTDCDDTACEPSSASEDESVPSKESVAVRNAPTCFRPPPGLTLPSANENSTLPSEGLEALPPGLDLPFPISMEIFYGPPPGLPARDFEFRTFSELPWGRSNAAVVGAAPLSAPFGGDLSPDFAPVESFFPAPEVVLNGAGPPGLNTFGNDFTPKGPFDRASFRKRLTDVLRQLALDHNTGRAIQAVREEHVPLKFQKTEYGDILTRVSEMRNARNRRITFAFAAGLSTVFEKSVCLSAMKEHIRDIVPELVEEVPHLPAVLLTELCPTLRDFFSALEVESIKTDIEGLMV
mmetsp:Transcript_72930/g.152259  ORF Transcript_72930/g.152259 Transcript_72930/m.152259 type:complete len:393 (+) Transcript_72930:343-1521(+)|eukprot:CAMPEP_0206569930 /NCGR_PEP_ID=MMETSP0325_2-20121206/26725_1 /ASSEMBLY_ACC=CAM_ASM_000347 /TAXON_ID=2866 /ORGANISM="Crypthecodinium cohnii, Strain Seligo" /LENGTH=392 /DNA_ID=CAMNT_0054073601 /DNA_START=275 /DNA_END=1453 /DNA_ORIENTATION=-